MKVIIADSTVTEIPEFLPTHLREKITWLICNDFDEAKLCELLVDTNIYVDFRLTAAMAKAARVLRFIQVTGAGLDKISFEALSPDVIVANTFHHERSIAEYVLMTMIALSRQLLPTDEHLRQGVWHGAFYNSALPLYDALRGRTLGLIGFGHIGVEVARLASCFEMEIMAIKSKVDADLAAQYGLDFLGGSQDLPELLRRSDFVVVAAPLTEQTWGIIGPDQLALMKPTSYLINVARAAIIDEAALYRALAEHRIAGAALDVWYNYPTDDKPTLPASFPFHQLDNVILTPHVSGSTNDTFRRRAQEAAANIERLMTGQPLTNVVRPG